MAVVKWTIGDGITTHVFEINPDPKGADGEISPERTIIDSYVDAGLPMAAVGQSPPLQAAMDITVIDQAEYDALWSWWDTGKILTLTDDLGRSFQIYLSAFDAKRVRKSSLPYFHNLKISYFVLSLTDI